MLAPYLHGIDEVTRRGDAREESYYSTLEELLKLFSVSFNIKKVHVTTLPKKTEAGNPDFRIWDGTQHIVGYVEAKDPSVDLDKVERSEQLLRYRGTFPNLILTNFVEFRLYRNGDLVEHCSLIDPHIKVKLPKDLSAEKEGQISKLFERFYAFSLPKVYDARALAVELAKRTRFLKDEIVSEELKEEESKGTGFILSFYEAFRQYLVAGLTKEDFADLFSQTITYGLFAARTRSVNEFNRKLAYDMIPATIGMLRDVFRFISLGDLPKQMEWIIDDISEVLAVTDVNEILHEYFHEGKGKDPIIHFYETFLAQYDPKKREGRGVYYTPEPVVSYIARSLNSILINTFQRADGFASESVKVLDPAAGTLTFLAEVTKLAVSEFVTRYGEGGKEDFIRSHVLEDFYGFELMMAPYAVGHLKMSYLLEELGYKLKENDRFKFYLTNTLEMENLAQTALPGMSSLSEESRLAGDVKKKIPILVILGNPPYEKLSVNKGAWITKLIEDYKYVDGKHFGEKKHWLTNDYVKFIRFAQWKIEQAGEGIVGLITGNRFVGDPTFRGMRRVLMKAFDEIYILDLHGDTMYKDKTPDGSKDENVFDIQRGVAISIFVKKRGSHNGCEVHYSERFGSREQKYDWLLTNDLETTEWDRLEPNTPNYFFKQIDERNRADYDGYVGLTSLFPINGTGIVTSRDDFVIDVDEKALRTRIMDFRDTALSDEEVKSKYLLNENYMWRVSQARKDLMQVNNWEDYFEQILYRPFDTRFIYLHKSVVWRIRKVTSHMMDENLSLITARSNKSSVMDHFFCSDKMSEAKCGESTTQSYLFPLYLYPSSDKRTPRKLNTATDRESNIPVHVIKALSDSYSREVSPEEIFYYTYAVMFSNKYREKYSEFLKNDFPRIPLTREYNVFKNMLEYGRRLINLHLLKSDELDSPFARFEGRHDNRIVKPIYDEVNNKVWINQIQYFDGVTKNIWDYTIGGYQICEKWLKDRKDWTLSLNDIKHYCRIVSAIHQTIALQKAIDEIYPSIEEDLLTISDEVSKSSQQKLDENI